MEEGAVPEIAARIDARINALGTTERAVSIAAFGHHRGISQIRRHGNPGIETLRRLAASLQVSPGFLAYGEGEERGPAAPMPAPHRPGRAILLPIAGEVAAGQWLEVDAAVDAPAHTAQPLAADPRWPAEAQFAVVVRGTSINRVAPDGAVLGCVDTRQIHYQAQDGDLLIIQRTRHEGRDMERTAKRYRRAGERFELWPDSTDTRHRPLIIDPQADEGEGTSVEIIGLVTRVAHGVPPELPWQR